MFLILGPNYQKKKKPHRVIAFADLTKEIAIRWQNCKEEFHRKYDPIVKAQKARDKAEKEVQEKENKNAELTISRATAEKRHSYINAEGPCASSPRNTYESNQFSDSDRNTHGMPNESFSLKEPSSCFESNSYDAKEYQSFESMKHHENFDYYAEYSKASHDYR